MGVGFILDHVGKILDWTNDSYAAGIVRAVGSYFPELY